MQFNPAPLALRCTWRCPRGPFGAATTNLFPNCSHVFVKLGFRVHNSYLRVQIEPVVYGLLQQRESKMEAPRPQFVGNLFNQRRNYTVARGDASLFTIVVSRKKTTPVISIVSCMTVEFKNGILEWADSGRRLSEKVCGWRSVNKLRRTLSAVSHSIRDPPA